MAISLRARPPLSALDRFDHVARLVVLVERGVQAQRLAVLAVGPQLLAQASLVVGDQGVGGLEDRRGGTVVLLQADHLGVGEVVAELLDVLDPCATPAVDRLVVVTDHHQAVAALGKNPQPGVLHGVGVLELVHQDMAEAPLVVLEHAGMVAPEVQGAQQQLGEVDHPGAGAGRLVGFVDLQHGGEEQVAAGLDVLRPQALVLLPVDEPLGLARRPALLVEAEFADHPLDQALLVVAVEDLEVLAQPGLAPVRAQQAMGEAVEGADPHARRIDPEQLLDAVAHLRRRLVGEGHRQDAVGRGVLDLDQPGDPVHQHAGLARAGAGEDQLAAQRRGHGLALRVVEGVQQEGEVVVHRGILPGRGKAGQTGPPFGAGRRSVGPGCGKMLYPGLGQPAPARLCSGHFKANHYKNKRL